MTTPSSPAPDPGSTPGLDRGGAQVPGDTPPVEDSMSGAAENRDRAPNLGPVSGNRTPMFIGLGLLVVLVILPLVIYGIAQIAGYAN